MSRRKTDEEEQAARATVAGLAREDADRLSFWESTCRSAMQRAGRAPDACEIVARAATQLRGLASCLERPSCIALAEDKKEDES